MHITEMHHTECDDSGYISSHNLEPLSCNVYCAEGVATCQGTMDKSIINIPDSQGKYVLGLNFYQKVVTVSNNCKHLLFHHPVHNSFG